MHTWRRRFSHPRRRLIQQSNPVGWTIDSSIAVNIHQRRRFERLNAGNPRLRIPSALPESSHSKATVSTMATVFPSKGEIGNRHPEHIVRSHSINESNNNNSTIQKPVFSSGHSSATNTNSYRCPGSSGDILVHRGDLQTLGPGCMLNDTIIEVGLGFWLEDMGQKSPKLASEVYVFSPFLYVMLNKTGKSMEDCYHGVRKWTSKIDIFEKSYLIIPIIEKSHWYLAIVYKPQYMLKSLPKNCTPVKEHDGEHAPTDTYTDDEESEHLRIPEETTFIFIFDSASASFQHLFESHAWAISKIESYLQLEAVDKKAHKIHQTKCAEGKEACVPCQPNSYDCGIFLLHFAKTFMSNPKHFYSVITRERRLGHDISIGERQAHWDTSRVTELRASIASRIKKSPLAYRE